MSTSLKIRFSGFFWLLPALMLIGSGTISAATKTLTIKGSSADSGDTIQIPDTAEINVAVADQGITITMPDLDLRLRCLGEVTADGYCYVAAGASGGGGAALTDGDGDRVPDDWDGCPNTPTSALYTDNRGCADLDGDGVFTPEDACPSQGGQVDSTGCPITNVANTYTVTASAGAGGSISPAGQLAVAEGGTSTFTLTADSGFSFNRISGSCPSGTTSGTTHTTGAITANCTVVAEFTATNTTDTSEYCAGTPAGVICDPNSDGRRNPGGTMDPWTGDWGFDNTPIPNGKVVAYPFLASGGASGASGIVQFTNNMGDLTVSGYRWKGWFSESPGGALLNGAIACRKFSANPNPINMQWSQAANSGSFDCNLGQAERVLYFNMTVGCFEEGRACTVGAPFPGQPGYDSYYVKVYPR